MLKLYLCFVCEFKVTLLCCLISFLVNEMISQHSKHNLYRI